MAVSPRSDSFEVTDYLAVLRRRWWIVFGLVCLGTLAAAAYVAVTPKSYTATTGVYVTANAANVNNVAGSRTATGPTVNMDNEAQVVKSITVAAKAASDLHSRRSADQLAGQVSVAVPANTSLLNISCTAPSATGSAACAQAFARAYLAVRQGNALDKIANVRTQLESRSKPLQAQAIKLKNKVKTLPANSTELATTKAELQDTVSKLDVLRKGLSTLGASVNTNAGNIITPALVPQTPSNPRPLLYVPSGLLVGLLLGLVLASAVDRRDDRIHSAADVERFLDMPVLFSLPLKRLSLQTSIVSPRSRAGRAFTDLAQAVAAGLGDGNHVILVAGTSAGEGGSVIAANLAATLARTRSDVILVCADLRDSVTPQLLGVGDGRGLAEVLAGHATISEVARRPAEVVRLRVITPGVDTSAALNHLQHDATRRIVAELLGATVLPPIRGKSRSAARAAKPKPKPKQDPRFAQAAVRPGQAKPRTLPADPRSRVLPGQGQSQRAGMPGAAARAAGETWPLPRVPVGSAQEGKTPLPVPDDPADKPAGSS